MKPAASSKRPESHLLRGTLDLLVLRSLSWGPLHGYGVAEWIESATRDALQIAEGTIYPALHRMEARGLIASEWGLSENNRRAKFYRLTPAGARHLAGERRRWHDYAAAMGRALGATPGAPR
ncbi:MAG TPA: PadR family transcriptional regulator [Thermoanaerobaculia bacterium]|nr:PadR family transcriptional regulator [Thermoanaerobaculia bacterium]